MSILPVFPPEIEFVFPDDIGAFTCRLAWRRSHADGTSRWYWFQWPAPGEWTPTVEADSSDAECSFGLHAAKNWRGALGRTLFQLVAVPVGEIAHEDRNKLRFRRAAVVAHPDVVGMIRAGKFAGANMEGASLGWLDLTGANLSGTNLAGADFTEAILIDADFTEAILIDADFTEAILTDANFIDANLTGAVGPS